MMTSVDTLQKIEQLAELLYTPEEICKIMQVEFYDYEPLFEDKAHPIYKAYYTGFFTAETKHREGLIKLANMGSGPAQAMVSDLIKKSKMR